MTLDQDCALGDLEACCSYINDHPGCIGDIGPGLDLFEIAKTVLDAFDIEMEGWPTDNA